MFLKQLDEINSDMLKVSKTTEVENGIEAQLDSRTTVSLLSHYDENKITIVQYKENKVPFNEISNYIVVPENILMILEPDVGKLHILDVLAHLEKQLDDDAKKSGYTSAAASVQVGNTEVYCYSGQDNIYSYTFKKSYD